MQPRKMKFTFVQINMKQVSYNSAVDSLSFERIVALSCFLFWIISLECVLMVSKSHNETHDPKWQENKIYTLVKGRELFYRRHTVPVTSCSEVKYVLKRVSFVSKDCTKELKLECAYFLGQTS